MGQASEDILDGTVCSWCGEFFTEPHGYPVLCADCIKDDPAAARKAGLVPATKRLLCDEDGPAPSVATVGPPKPKAQQQPNNGKPQKFWMVFNSSGKAPTKRHSNVEKATGEAERIAAARPGVKCYVLEAIGYVSTGPAKERGEFGPVEHHEF